MGLVIEGRSGIPVESTSKGQLLTQAEHIEPAYQEALEGNAYFFPLDGVATNGAEHIMVIKNTSANDLVVTCITIFVAGFKDSTRVKVYLNETFTYAAGGTVVVPVNMKSGIVGGAVGNFYTLAAAGTDITTFAGTAAIAGIYIFERYPITITCKSGWVVPTNQVFSLYNIGNDNTFYGGIDFYYRT